jgi:hypothetical protein
MPAVPRFSGSRRVEASEWVLPPGSNLPERVPRLAAPPPFLPWDKASRGGSHVPLRRAATSSS